MYLLTTYYNDKNKERHKELSACLKANINCGLFDKIFVLVEHKDSPIPHYNEKTVIVNVKKRPYYSDFINLSNIHIPDKSIIVIANSDITFDNSLNIASNIGDNEVYALSRYDVNNRDNAVLLNRRDSQDVWILKTKVKGLWCDFPLGKAGCDNRFAYELVRANYNVYNPCFDIKTYHHHVSGVRNYNVNNLKDRVSPPYAFIEPSYINHKKKAVIQH